MSMTIQSSVKDKILATSSETSKVENAPAEMLRDLDQQMEKRADDGCTLWIKLYSKYEYEIRYHPACSLDEIEVDKILCFVEEPVKNSDYEVMSKGSLGVVVEVRFLTSLLDDGRGSGSWMFLFVWSGYAAMRTLLWAGKVVSSSYIVESSWNSKSNFVLTLASNWLERLPTGFITTWEDLTTRLLAQFFPPGRTAKLRNDTLMFQQHHGESLSKAWTRFKDLLQKVPHHGIDLWLQVQIFYDHVNPVTRRTIDQSASGKLRELNAEESWALLENLAIYDNECWNDPRDFAKPVKAITLPRCPDGPHDTQYYMKDPEQAFVEYASSRTDEVGDKWYTFKPEENNLGDTYNPSWKIHPNLRLSKFEVDFKQQQSEMTNKINTVLKAIIDRKASMLPSDTVKNLKLGTHPVLSAHSYLTNDPQCSTHIHSLINAITIHPKQPKESQDNESDVGQEEKGNLGNINSNRTHDLIH
ncbi:MAK10-like protein [Tanacetum coccineum]|uniref:MAK10-like protein n=1 Tax=Tanacetum coccineum TaxID=301880 RepID=A0ABQ4Y711_9ASTR